MAKKKQRKRAGFTIPIAVVAGAGAQALPVIEKAAKGDWGGVVDKLLYQYGCYNKTKGAFDLKLVGNYAPLIVGLIIHVIASKLGLNRILGRAKIPYFRI